MPIHVNSSLVIPDAELDWKFSASGGPGGQHANRSNTRAELTWDVAGSAVLTGTKRELLTSKLGSSVRIVSDEHRSQTRNREAAEERLGERVREALKQDRPRRATKPTKGSKRRRVEGKRRTSQTKKLRGKPSLDD